tara:strand:- start:193 stop:999 length:807 start_codon:yes stop_codon:yes gene_type:complete
VYSKVNINNSYYRIDFNKFFDLSIPLDFEGKQVNFFDTPRSKVKALESDGRKMLVSQGASCDVQEVTVNIHCTTTHTECVGHISKENIFINEVVNRFFFPSTLITVNPIESNKCNEKYHVDFKVGDMVISKAMLEQNLKSINPDFLEALIVRTIPNSLDKRFFNYRSNQFPFFTNDAIHYLNQLNVQHLLFDCPSIDRSSDGGFLGNHRIFWDINDDIDQSKGISRKTITELIYIFDLIKDGTYILELQIGNIKLDASYSRPIIYPHI